LHWLTPPPEPVGAGGALAVTVTVTGGGAGVVVGAAHGEATARAVMVRRVVAMVNFIFVRGRV